MNRLKAKKIGMLKQSLIDYCINYNPKSKRSENIKRYIILKWMNEIIKLYSVVKIGNNLGKLFNGGEEIGVDCEYGTYYGKCNNKAEFNLTFRDISEEDGHTKSNYNRKFCLKHTANCLDCDNFIKLEKIK